MKTQAWVTRMVCGTAVLLWTGVGFADDLTNLLRLVQAVAQERSGASRSDRSGRERSQDSFQQPAARTSRESFRRNQEQDWPEQSFDRSSRQPLRGRGPSPESRVPSGSIRQPNSSRSGSRPGFYGDHGLGHEQGYDPDYNYNSRSDFSSDRGFGNDGRFPNHGWVEERQSAELSLSFGSDRFRVAYGTPRTVPGYMAPRPIPVPVPVHQVGEIVRCRVPLATCVRVRGADHICGHFVPAIVAVRDPALCEHDVDRLVYIQIMVPPTPPRKIEVSRCHTRVELCYGELDVEIVSKNGLISVEYDD